MSRSEHSWFGELYWCAYRCWCTDWSDFRREPKRITFLAETAVLFRRVLHAWAGDDVKWCEGHQMWVANFGQFRLKLLDPIPSQKFEGTTVRAQSPKAMSLSWAEQEELHELLHRLGASDDHMLGLEEQETEKTQNSKFSKEGWRLALNELSKILSGAKVHGQAMYYSGDLLSLVFQAAGILQSLDLSESSALLVGEERPKTMNAIASLAMKFHSQTLHMKSDFVGVDPVREAMLLKLAEWQVLPTADHWLSVFESRLSALKSETARLGVAKQLYQRSLWTASMALFQGQGRARRLASSHFALSCYEAGKVRQLSLSVPELVWVLGLAKESDIVDLQDDIQHAEAIIAASIASAASIQPETQAVWLPQESCTSLAPRFARTHSGPSSAWHGILKISVLLVEDSRLCYSIIFNTVTRGWVTHRSTTYFSDIFYEQDVSPYYDV